jgi:glucose/arabinose dehydrogenase
MSRIILRFTALLIAAAATALPTSLRAQSAARQCSPNNAGLTLPPGFCAQIVADSVRSARHVVVAPNGDLVIAQRNTRDSVGGVVVLRDTNGDGVADQRRKFFTQGGTGIAFFDNHLYFAMDTAIVRWAWRPGDMVPSGNAETIVTGLAVQGAHAAKTIAIARDGSLYVNIGAPSNACQERDRIELVRGQDPCPLLERSGGIWRFDARKAMQRQADGSRFATGLRNVVALTIGPDGSTLWGVQHGRDLLAGNWQKANPLFTNEKSAENPAEELFRIERNGDYVWPYCYFDVDSRKKVLAPEYGGDGAQQGRCAGVGQPMAVFPGHWAPESIVFYTASQFPNEYRGGAFVAFHGSWNRAPLPQAGFNVSFVPFADGRPNGTYRVFADGFRGGPNEQRNRPMGTALDRDGSLIVTDDTGGRIYRVRWVGRGAG